MNGSAPEMAGTAKRGDCSVAHGLALHGAERVPERPHGGFCGWTRERGHCPLCGDLRGEDAASCTAASRLQCVPVSFILMGG